MLMMSDLILFVFRYLEFTDLIAVRQPCTARRLSTANASHFKQHHLPGVFISRSFSRTRDHLLNMVY